MFGVRWVRILVQVTINRRLMIGRDGHLDQSEAYLYENTGPESQYKSQIDMIEDR